ncbi:MAG: hypothetical protein SNJ84_00930 [Verrucomicrobiia bacterium]
MLDPGLSRLDRAGFSGPLWPSWLLVRAPSRFDPHRQRSYPPTVHARLKRSVQIGPEIVAAAKERGLSLSDYIAVLHQNQRSVRVAYAASIYRSFALLELARLPLDPAYYELVESVMGPEEGQAFRLLAGSGVPLALPRAAAALLGADTRARAVEGILLAAHAANLLHEGFIEAARLLEATHYR